jgi:hypothetical protein
MDYSRGGIIMIMVKRTTKTRAKTMMNNNNNCRSLSILSSAVPVTLVSMFTTS